MAFEKTKSDTELEALTKRLQSIAPSDFGNELERVNLKSALFAALAKVETPWETALRITFTQPSVAAVLKICWDIDLFQKWSSPPLSGGSQTAAQLAKLVDVDEKLLARILTHLYATEMLERTGQAEYQLTAFTMSLGISDIGSTVPFLYNTTLPGFANLPIFLNANKYIEPTDASHTNWHHLRGHSRFDGLRQSPDEMAHFQRVMSLRAANRAHWTDIYPLNRVLHAARRDRTLVVDVGGGYGHDLNKLRGKIDNAFTWPGMLVLQDRTQDEHQLVPGEELVAMSHNFFQEQPVEGARFYYLHGVLHDWPDTEAVVILKRLKDAMENGYSHILIHETAIGEDPSPHDTTSDIHMMMVLSSFERTTHMWTSLVESAGLRVEKIWSSLSSSESVIEAVIA